MPALTKEEEQGILALVNLNRLTPRKEIEKSFSIRRLQITFSWRSRKNLWGRFGGGWNWSLGFEAGGHSLHLLLLTYSLMLTLKRKEVKNSDNRRTKENSEH